MVSQITKAQMKEAADYLKAILKDKTPDIIIQAGSGFDFIASKINPIEEIGYSSIPNFYPCIAPTHKGSLLVGEFNNSTVALLRGRFHYYEGYTLGETTFPVSLLAHLGATKALLTSSVGSVSGRAKVGSVLILQDYINLVQDSPSRYYEKGLLPNLYPDCTKPFLHEVYNSLLKEDYGIEVSKGVLAFLSGPAFETRAELTLLKNMEADIVGWSLVPEAIICAAFSLKTVGLSLVTDFSDPIEGEPVNIKSIFEKASTIEELLSKIIENILRFLENEE